MLPVGIFLCIVTAEAEVKVLADIAVYSAAHDESPAVVAGVFHVDHFMIVFMTLRLGTTWYKKHTLRLNLAVETLFNADNKCPRLVTTVFLDFLIPAANSICSICLVYQLHSFFFFYCNEHVTPIGHLPANERRLQLYRMSKAL